MVDVGSIFSVFITDMAGAARIIITIILEVEDRDHGVDIDSTAADSHEGKAPARTLILDVASTQVESAGGGVEERCGVSVATRLLFDVAELRVWVVEGSDAQSLLKPVCFAADLADVVQGQIHHVAVNVEALTADCPS